MEMVIIFATFGLLFFMMVFFITAAVHVHKPLGMKLPNGFLICLWMSLLGVFLFGMLSHALSSGAMPSYRRVSPSDVYGTYRIDRSFYPGRNADWQYDHFKFVITPENTFILTEIDDKGIAHQYMGKVTWKDTETRRVLWSAKLNTPHHLSVESPALYRSYFSYYYVIRSKKYGNMFFRKESTYPFYEFGFSIVAIPVLLLWRKRRRQKLSKEFQSHV